MRSKYEIKAQKELEALGYRVDWKIRPSSFRNPHGYNVDYFNIGDLLAYHPQTGELKIIAIKGHQGVPYYLRRAIEMFKPTKIVKEIWTYRLNKTIRKEVIPDV